MSNDSPTLVQTQERLVSAIRSEISEAEDTLSATADQVGEKMVKLRSRIENRLREAKFRLIDAEEALLARTREAAHAANDYVHESPWTAIGVAAGVGAVVGLLLGRACNEKIGSVLAVCPPCVSEQALKNSEGLLRSATGFSFIKI